MKLFVSALALGVTISAAPVAVTDADAQRYRTDRARAGTYVFSLFSEDKEIDCTIPRGVSRLCLGVPDRLARPRRRIEAVRRDRARRARQARRGYIPRHRTRRD